MIAFGVIQFPGSNCDDDALAALRSFEGVEAHKIWHQERSIGKVDALILPGGFSYGDYLRCGAIARFSPIMEEVQRAAFEGKLILGICNGFQILCEAGLLPGALTLNQGRLFRCHDVCLSVERHDTPFTTQFQEGKELRLPIAHMEGRYVASAEVLHQLEAHGQILFRYTDRNRSANLDAHQQDSIHWKRLGENPNGAFGAIAGITNRPGNVLGMMPHPERACNPLLSNSEGRALFLSMMEFLEKKKGVA